MLLGLTAVAVAACFCLTPTPLPEQLPMAPDALTTHAVAPADAIPQRCLTGSRAWAHTLPACPQMPSQVLHTQRAHPLLFGRAF